MNKLLVSVFDSDEKAFEGLAALKDLHRQGDITVYASTVIAKDSNGVAKVRDAAEDAPVGTLVGIFGGAVVGLIGGPVGVAVGAYVGGLGGMFYDLFRHGISMDFIDEVSTAIEPGTVAVVADVDESWVTPVDTRFAPLGARIYRRVPSEEMEDDLTREVEAANNELAQLRAELRDSTEEAKSGIKSQIDAQVKKLEELDQRIEQRLATADVPSTVVCSFDRLLNRGVLPT